MVKCSYCGIEVENPITCPYCGGSYCKDHGQLQRHNCSSIQKTSKTKEENKDNLVNKPSSAVTENEKKSLAPMEKKGVYLLVIISIFAILGSWVIATIRGNSIGYDIGFINGYSSGKTNAAIIGYSIGFTEGNLTEYNPNYEIGYASGFVKGNSTGYLTGIDVGNQTGFTNGKNIGQTEGYREAYQEYYSLGECEGNRTGYVQSYFKGREDIKKHAFNLTNPTYSEMIQFLAKDRTDRIRYDPDSFVCHDYSVTVKTNAFNEGYYCYYVTINQQPDSPIPVLPIFSHAIVAFNTTDRGLIFVEPQHDDIIELIIGKSYSKLNGYVSPIYDDTIHGYTLMR